MPPWFSTRGVPYGTSKILPYEWLVVSYVSANRSAEAHPVQGEIISHSQSWEDPALLEAALRVGPEDDVLSVCGAGDNAFALANMHRCMKVSRS